MAEYGTAYPLGSLKDLHMRLIIYEKEIAQAFGCRIDYLRFVVFGVVCF
jgi:hypothetical protein